jgi:hypothetical protein
MLHFNYIIKKQSREDQQHMKATKHIKHMNSEVWRSTWVVKDKGISKVGGSHG